MHFREHSVVCPWQIVTQSVAMDRIRQQAIPQELSVVNRNSVSRAMRSSAEPTMGLQHQGPTASDALRAAIRQSLRSLGKTVGKE